MKATDKEGTYSLASMQSQALAIQNPQQAWESGMQMMQSVQYCLW
jgi:hypothetical protein